MTIRTNQGAPGIRSPDPRLSARRRLTHSGGMSPGRSFLRAHSLVRRIAPSLHPIWSGPWLGILSNRGLDAIDEAYYHVSVKYSGSQHNRRSLFAWEDEAIRAYFSGCSRVMVLGAGGGREVIALRHHGFEADGWESHPKLVAAAREILDAAGCAGAVRMGPRSRAPEGAESYHGVILGWTMYTLVPGRETRIELLRGARARLIAGAPLLLSFHYRPEDSLRSDRVLRAARAMRTLLRRGSPELGDDLAPNYLHRFTREEIRQELETGGFRLVRFEQLGPGPYGEGWAIGRAA